MKKNKNKNDKFIKLLMIFIMIQPFFDVFVYFMDKVLNINVPFISFIRPIISISIYFYLLFNVKITNKQKKTSFAFLVVYAVYCIIHLFNIRNNFFELSYGNLFNEVRFLSNYGYFLLQTINFYLIFKISNDNDRKKILLSVVYAASIISILYLISVVTGTSPKTYIYSVGKQGWKGWSVSSHYVGHALVYIFPILIYSLFEKNYMEKWYKYLITILVIIPCFYLVGTKTPLFAVSAITIFYTIMRIVDVIKNGNNNKETMFFIIVSLIMIFTFRYTFGYDNFKNQINISNGDDVGDVNMIEDNLKNSNKFSDYEKMNNDKLLIKNFDDRMMLTLYNYRDIKSSVFDNRTIQKTLNKYLWSISSFKDKLFGYGQSDMPNCTWVETDFFTIFYCYGIVGFILIILIPLGYISFNGIRCLIKLKQMTRTKFLMGFGFCIGLFILYSVGYTLQFAQTVFYLSVLLSLSNLIFKDVKIKEGKNRDYLFCINDLNIGGAEVGMVDVVNELVKNNKKVDIVLLRKRGPLLEKIDKNVNIYSIINTDDSKIKQKVYHIFYMLGGIFIKYVYKKVIKSTYKTEIAYLEGYPAVFIAASNNPDSIKIASIRVGLKNHKLKASKLPWGNYEVKKAYKKMDNIYTVSDLTTTEFLDKYPFCKGKTSTIYTYFNVDEMRIKALEKYDFSYDKNKINFLAVGRFSEQKSYDRLIEAFKIIATENKNVLLHFVGNDKTDIGNKIKKLIEDYDLKDRIILHGVQNNPYPYIRDCDCLISSSLYEGFPRVINEAIALGKLCIGTNVTGTKEALHDGKLGILVNDSIEGLVDGMEKYISDPDIFSCYKKEIEKFDGNKKSYFDGLELLNTKKKKMIIYMPKLSFGGMEKALVNLINYAKLNDKYDLTLYLVYKGDMNYIDLLPKNIKLIIACPNKFNTFGKLLSGVKLVCRYIYHVFNKYDIAISYSYQHPILCSLTRFASDNSIVYIHGNLEQGISNSVLNNRLKTCKYQKFNKIICVSQDAKDVLCRLLNRDDKVYVVNNVIDGDQIMLKAEEEIDDFKFEKNKIYFINVCRHSDLYKKLLRIVTATEKLNKDGYDFEVIFIGDGEDHQLYLDTVKKLDIKNIHFLGKKSNPYKYLAKSSAFVLSSIREGYPVVFIESMVLNIPIITTNVSDAKKDIDGKFGIVVPNDDTSIYDGMKEFLDNGFKIKTKFNYIDFNSNIEKEIDRIYNEE